MNQNESKLLFRSLKDVQAQADRILSGDKSHEAIRSFAHYSVELKKHIAKNVEDEHIKHYLIQIPDIKHSRTEIKLWQFIICLMLPVLWVSLYQIYKTREKSIAEVRVAGEKYANLEIMLKGII